MNRKLQKEMTRQKLLKTSMRLFTEKGYDRVSIDEIVKEAESSKGAFYHHFYSKDAILIEVLNILREKLLNEVQEIVFKGNRQYSSSKVLEQIFDKVLSFHYAHYERFNLLVKIANGASINSRIFHLEDLQSILAMVVTVGSASGEFTFRTNPEFIAKHIAFSMDMAIYEAFSKAQDENAFREQLKTDFETIIHVVLFGIIAER